jgi:Spy/CpxP family protein refolding chaperone
MKKILLGTLVLAVCLPLAASAQGWGRGYGRGYGRGMGRGWGGRGWGRGLGPGPMALASLDLTAAQKKKIEELRADYDRRISDLQARLDVLRSEMAELWSADRPDRKAILAKHREIDVVRGQMREEGVDLRLAVMDLLTTDQLEKLRTFGGRRGPGRGLGPCGRGMGWGRGGGKGRGMGWWYRFEDSP